MEVWAKRTTEFIGSFCKQEHLLEQAILHCLDRDVLTVLKLHPIYDLDIVNAHSFVLEKLAEEGRFREYRTLEFLLKYPFINGLRTHRNRPTDAVSWCIKEIETYLKDLRGYDELEAITS